MNRIILVMPPTDSQLVGDITRGIVYEQEERSQAIGGFGYYPCLHSDEEITRTVANSDRVIVLVSRIDQASAQILDRLVKRFPNVQVWGVGTVGSLPTGLTFSRTVDATAPRDIVRDVFERFYPVALPT